MSKNQYFEDLKDLFKSKKRLKEEEAQEIGQAVKDESKIIDDLKRLDKQYKDSIKKETPDFDSLFPKTKLERVQYDVDSDNQIVEKANDIVQGKYVDKISKINADTINNQIKLSKEKQSANEDKIATLKEIESLYESLIKKTQNDSIKRGIQHSSIVDNIYKDIENYKASSENATYDDYNKTILNIDLALDNLEKSRLDALNDINIKKALEVSENIKKLKDERQDILNKQTIKNNDILKQENDLNIKALKAKDKYINDYHKNEMLKEQELNKFEKEHGYSGEKLQNYAERYNIALEFYMSLDPDIAPKALESSPNMKYYLGNFYDKLKGVLDRRTTTKRKKYL